MLTLRLSVRITSEYSSFYRFIASDRFFFFFNPSMKGMIESFHHIPLHHGRCGRNFFQSCSKPEVDDFVKVLVRKSVTILHISRFQPLVFQKFNIASVLNGGNRRKEGGRSADALGFNFSPGRFAVTRWWFEKAVPHSDLSEGSRDHGAEEDPFSQDGLYRWTNPCRLLNPERERLQTDIQIFLRH